MTKKLLFLFDTDAVPSVFDTVVGYDGGADHITGYGGVTPDNVGALVDGTIYTRGGSEKKSTAIFVGGGNMAAGEALFTAVKKRFFGPFRVSCMLDSNGSNTTAAAGVALVAKAAGSLQGKKAVVLAGTGPVGMRSAALLGREGAEVTIAGRALDKTQAAADADQQALRGQGEGRRDPRRGLARSPLVKGANLVFAAGAIGFELLPEAAWAQESSIEFVADYNAQPPTRHRRHRRDGQGQGPQRQAGVRRARHRRAEAQAPPGLRRPALREHRAGARRRGDLRARQEDGLTGEAPMSDTQSPETRPSKPSSTELASAAPTPGGGGAAAISGAMGAALVSMVCNLTIGKKKYVEVEAELKDVLAKSEGLRVVLTGMIGEDVQAFDAVMGAYGLPKAHRRREGGTRREDPGGAEDRHATCRSPAAAPVAR